MVTLEEIDFNSISNCNQVSTLQQYLKLLQDDGSCFQQLETACKKKIVELDPKFKYTYFPQEFAHEIEKERAEVAKWAETRLKKIQEATPVSIPITEVNSNQTTETIVNNLKSESNQRFSQGDLTGAYQKISQAIDTANQAPSSSKLPKTAHAVLYANRSQIAIKREDYPSALVDAETALRLDSGNFKAKFRIAVALYGMKKQIPRAIDLCNEVLKEYKDVLKQPATEAEKLIVQLHTELDKSQRELKSKPKVEEIIDDEPTPVVQETAPPVIIKEEETIPKQQDETPITVKKEEEEVVVSEKTDAVVTVPAVSNAPATVAAVAKAKTAEVAKETAPLVAPVAPSAPLPLRTEEELPAAPKNGLQFDHHLQSLKHNSVESFVTYLTTRVTVGLMKSLFGKHPIENDTLSRLIDHLDVSKSLILESQNDGKTHVINVLHELLSCGGMDMILMLLEENHAVKFEKFIMALESEPLKKLYKNLTC